MLGWRLRSITKIGFEGFIQHGIQFDGSLEWIIVDHGCLVPRVYVDYGKGCVEIQNKFFIFSINANLMPTNLCGYCETGYTV